MRFKPLKNLTLGKSKEIPEEEEDDEFKAIAANRIADMEKRIHIKTKDLEEKAQEIHRLSPKSDNLEPDGEIPGGPHGPLVELTLEADEKPGDVISLIDIPEDDESEEEEEVIKLVEVSAAVLPPAQGIKAPPPEPSAGSAEPPKKEEEIKLDDSNDSLNNLFNDDEEEENPLANLIKSLPDVTARELIDDLTEIKGIIKEWQNK
jgi:hypothetical protein